MILNCGSGSLFECILAEYSGLVQTGWGNEGEFVASLRKRVCVDCEATTLRAEGAAVGSSSPSPTMSTEVVNVSEYEELARQKLPKMIYDYYASGAEDQWTLKENRSAFERIRYAAVFFCPHKRESYS